MQDQQQQLIERLKQAQNVLVTVSKDPTVDQLSAAIGLTLALNHMDKHGTAVFSGNVPSTIEFLKPEETLEKNTDSLRDFIIALDKAKADKLRYKVEDQTVRIFITPYRTSISEKDLDFSQGDFNVDVVVALGVHDQKVIDDAIEAHGRILHDATVTSISTEEGSELGSINWVDPTGSSLSEMVSGLIQQLDKKVLDSQIATALLTGIVASTDRFSNNRTTPHTMTASALLMAAGANPQLIATELAAPPAPTPPASEGGMLAEQGESLEAGASAVPIRPPAEPGTLEIEHTNADDAEIDVDEKGTLKKVSETSAAADDGGTPAEPAADGLPEVSSVKGVPNESFIGTQASGTRDRIDEPPAMGAELTANTSTHPYDPAAETLTKPIGDTPLLAHNASVLNADAEPAAEPPQPAEVPNPPASPATSAAPAAELTLPAIDVSSESKPPETATMPALDLPPFEALGSEPAEPAPAANADASDEPAPQTDPLRALDDLLADAHSQPSAGAEPDSSAPQTAAAAPTPALSSAAPQPESVTDARDAVTAALQGTMPAAPPAVQPSLEPIVSADAQPLGPALHPHSESAETETPAPPPPAPPTPSAQYQPAPGFVPSVPSSAAAAPVSAFPGFVPPSPAQTAPGAVAPPPVPPPIIPA